MKILGGKSLVDTLAVKRLMTLSARRQRTQKFMLVDDEHINLLLLERILRRAGYEKLCSVEDPREALEAFQTFSPDLIVTDLHMPHINGIELIERLNARIPADAYLPIVMLTADLNPDLEQRALLGGAKDFFNKPFKANQITLRLRNLLQTRALHEALRRQNSLLETRVSERTAELEAAHLEGLERLALAADYRDHDTGLHTQRVGHLSAKIARKLGFSERDAVVLERAAPLHDVGKIGIPDSILLKPGRLDEGEFTVMKQHVRVGATLLSNGRSDLIKMAACVALTHHERWDGSGYPNGFSEKHHPPGRTDRRGCRRVRHSCQQAPLQRGLARRTRRRGGAGQKRLLVQPAGGRGFFVCPGRLARTPHRARRSLRVVGSADGLFFKVW